METKIRCNLMCMVVHMRCRAWRSLSLHCVVNQQTSRVELPGHARAAKTSLLIRAPCVSGPRRVALAGASLAAGN
jgi:hypothetical protein